VKISREKAAAREHEIQTRVNAQVEAIFAAAFDGATQEEKDKFNI